MALTRPPRSATAAATAGLLALVGLSQVVVMARKSVTYDEVPHIAAGWSYVKTGDVVLNPMHPPLVKELAGLAVLPVAKDPGVDLRTLADPANQRDFAWRFFDGQAVEPLVFFARLPAVGLTVLLGALIAAWARHLWGGAGAVLAVAVFALDPTIAAHGHLVTTDVAMALFSMLFVGWLRGWVETRSTADFLGSGLALGMALGAKLSAVLLVPVAVLLVFLADRLDADPETEGAGRPGAAARSGLRAAAAVAGLAAIAYPVLWILYLGPADPLFYVHALRSLAADANRAYFYFFAGEFSREGWLAYLPVAWAIKTPLPEILLLLAALVASLRARRARRIDELFLVVPPLVLFAAYALLSRPMGVRHLIPCFPFFYVSIGRLAPAVLEGPRLARAALAGVLVWSAVEFAAIWPDHVAYFNPLVGGPRGGLAWLDDSNVDWGQGLIQLREFVDERGIDDYALCHFGNLHPRAYGVTGRPVWIEALMERPGPGIWVLSSFCVARVSGWLRMQFGEGHENWLAHVEPEAVVGHVYHVYRLPDDGTWAGKRPAEAPLSGMFAAPRRADGTASGRSHDGAGRAVEGGG